MQNEAGRLRNLQSRKMHESFSSLWLDAPVLTNFEAVTLPLLYASTPDCEQYFSALRKNFPRKSVELQRIEELNMLARKSKIENDFLRCVEYLRLAANIRCGLFVETDYQVVSAIEHCVWSAIHLAVSSPHFHTQSAKLFLFAAGTLKLIPRLGKCNRAAILFVLHYNWTNYWARRGKWHAALQHNTIALAKWHELGIVSENILRFLRSRSALCYMCQKKIKEALSSLGPFDEAQSSSTGSPETDSYLTADPATEIPNVIRINIVQSDLSLSARPSNGWTCDGPRQPPIAPHNRGAMAAALNVIWWVIKLPILNCAK